MHQAKGSGWEQYQQGFEAEGKICLLSFSMVAMVHCSLEYVGNYRVRQHGMNIQEAERKSVLMLSVARIRDGFRVQGSQIKSESYGCRQWEEGCFWYSSDS